MLALHAYKNKNGNWPDSLSAVDSAMQLNGFGEAMIDPYSDKPFVYQVKDGRPVLYSVGANGVDDGGIRVTELGSRIGDVDLVFWPYQKPQSN
jgi:hypothetical protein